jgi:hypothetical protein
MTLIRSALAALALVTLSASSIASNFSASGAGGSIPDGLGNPGSWNGTYLGSSFSSTVTVASPVSSITAVKLDGLQHSWRGDLHITLKSPSGAAFSVVTRPGFDNTPGNFGDSGNYLVGNYTFAVAGGGAVNQGTASINPGTYNQYFNTGAGQWTGPGITNTPLGSISGPAGTWTLEVRDWAGGDVGALTGWTLEGTSPDSILLYCDMSDPNLTQRCQGEPGIPGHGCASSINSKGARLVATGAPLDDSVVLTQSGLVLTPLTIFLQGDANLPAGVQFGDGIRCVGGNLLRLYTKNAVDGVVSAPGVGELSLKQQSAALGDTIPAGATRYYQVYFRDVASVSGLNFNVGNAVQITWP